MTWSAHPPQTWPARSSPLACSSTGIAHTWQASLVASATWPEHHTCQISSRQNSNLLPFIPVQVMHWSMEGTWAAAGVRAKHATPAKRAAAASMRESTDRPETPKFTPQDSKDRQASKPDTILVQVKISEYKPTGSGRPARKTGSKRHPRHVAVDSSSSSSSSIAVTAEPYGPRAIRDRDRCMPATPHTHMHTRRVLTLASHRTTHHLQVDVHVSGGDCTPGRLHTLSTATTAKNSTTGGVEIR
jgi:hypothetical protein